MNIGIDIRPLMSPVRTGVGEYTFELLNAIFNQDTEHQYFLFYNSQSDVSRYLPSWQQPNVHFVATRYPNKLFNITQLLFQKPKLDRLIKNTSSSLDIFFSPNPNFTALTKTVKHILTIHDLSFEFFPEFYSTKQRLWHQLINIQKQCASARHILTPSENTKRDLINYYHLSPEKITVIYPGLSKNFQKHLADASSTEQGRDTQSVLRVKYHLPPHFILSFGTVEPRKNILGVIEAFELFKNQTSQNLGLSASDCHLVIAGSSGWKNQPIFKRINSSVYKEYIHVLGSIPAKDKAGLYSLADLFVYPSFYEGFGFPVLEAFTAQVPVITSNRSSLPEVAGRGAYLVNPHKPHELTLGMNTILAHQELKNRLIKNGNEQVKYFNWQKAAEEWLEVVKKL